MKKHQSMQSWHSEVGFRILSRVVERCPVSIIVTDALGRIEYVNPHFSQLTGYSEQEVTGRNPRLLQSGQTPPEQYQQLWKAILSGREWRGEFLNKKKNGELYWEAASISSLINSAGVVTHFIGVLEDVTERKRMDQLKDELLGRVSHELHTPIALIQWSIRTLQDELSGPLNERQKAVLQTVREDCERLDRMITELLDLSRLEAGKSRPQPKLLQLVPLLRASLQKFSGIAKQHQISLEEDFTELPVLYADPDLVVQVIGNLLDNAIRFAKSKVTVTVQQREQAIEVSVIDDGPGIPEPDRRRLFSKFEQINRPTGQNGYKGTGLGLAICKEIVNQQNGKIWVESVEGEGARFHFTLPLQVDAKEGL